jgi:hypothetical protein
MPVNDLMGVVLEPGKDIGHASLTTKLKDAKPKPPPIRGMYGLVPVAMAFADNSFILGDTTPIPPVVDDDSDADAMHVVEPVYDPINSSSSEPESNDDDVDVAGPSGAEPRHDVRPADDAVGDEATKAIRLPGLKTYDTAKGVARCGLCKMPIPKGMFRLQYRFKAGTRLSDLTYAHPLCAARLPLATRTDDVKILDRWMEDEAINEEAYETLFNVGVSLRGGVAGGSAGYLISLRMFLVSVQSCLR